MPGSVFITDPVTFEGFGVGNPMPVEAFPAGSAGSNATPVNSSSGNVVAATATATLAAAAGKTNFLTGFEVTGSGATANSTIVGTITGLLGGTLSYALNIGALPLGTDPLTVDFSTPLPATGAAVAISVSFPSFGAGATNTIVNARGFRQ